MPDGENIGVYEELDSESVVSRKNGKGVGMVMRCHCEWVMREIGW